MPQKSNKQESSRSQKLVVFTGIAVIVLIVVVFAYQQWSSNNSVKDRTVSVFMLDKQPALGASSAKVKVVEFGDYKCPVCRRFEEEIFPRLKAEFIDTGKVEFFFINFQFIAPDSVTAGIAGECIYHQNKAAFWNFHEAIYRNQGDESQIWATPANLLQLAREHITSGIDYQVLQTCIDKRQYASDVQEDEKIGNRAGVDSTPTIFVNGKKITNWSYGNLQSAIEQALTQ